MQVYRDETPRLPRSVVTVGAFDGVHRGHQALIRRTVERARKLRTPSVAYTFDPPPRAYFQDAKILTSLSEKLEYFETLGLDHAVVATFDASYAERSTAEFLEELVTMNPVEVWVGPDFRFGRGQAGDASTLKTRFAVRVFEPVRCRGGKEISSTLVRGLLARGAIDEANDLLGWRTW